jgi:hypothetical protein
LVKKFEDMMRYFAPDRADTVSGYYFMQGNALHYMFCHYAADILISGLMKAPECYSAVLSIFLK